jgi:hypothetical protein
MDEPATTATDEAVDEDPVNVVQASVEAFKSEAATADQDASVQNGRQLGIKVSMNSVYGFNGVSAKKGLLPCKPVAAVTTLKGRAFIEVAKNYVERTYEGSIVVYGDSVTGDTPLFIRTHDDEPCGDAPRGSRGDAESARIALRTIDDLVPPDSPLWRPYGRGKEAVDLLAAGCMLQTWSDAGFTRVHRIIRHALAPSKRLVRVSTWLGMVDCTDDHSLVLASGDKVSPRNVTHGTPLLHDTRLPHAMVDEPSVPPPAPVARSKVGAPHAGWREAVCVSAGESLSDKDRRQGCQMGGRANVALSRTAVGALGYLLGVARFDGHAWWAPMSAASGRECPLHDLPFPIDVIGHTGTNCHNSVVRISFPPAAHEWERSLVRAGRACVPDCVLTMKDATAAAQFHRGFRFGVSESARSLWDDKLLVAGVQLVGAKANITDSLHLLYMPCDTVQPRDRNPHAVCSMADVTHRVRAAGASAATYVYDLETDNHHFAVGPGHMVVHNTDSVMIYWGRDIPVEEAYRLGGEAAKAITILLRSGTVEGLGGAGYEARQKALRQEGDVAHVAAAGAGAAGAVDLFEDDDPTDTSPARDLEDACQAVDLTNEKAYVPYLLDKKKRYAGLKWVMNEDTGEFVAKLDMKGIDAVRRDRPKFVRDACTKLLNALLYDKSVDKARDVLCRILEDMLADRMPVSAFIMSKSVRGSYKGGVENLPQVQAWRRMQQRGDDGVPPIGARMPYLIVAPSNGSDGGTDSEVKLYARAEHPSYVRSAELPIDLVYYIQQLTNPICKLVEHVKMAGVPALFAHATDRANAKIKGIRLLHDFMVPDAGASAGAGASADEDGSFMVHNEEDAMCMRQTARPRPAPKKSKAVARTLTTQPTKQTRPSAPARNLLTMFGE